MTGTSATDTASTAIYIAHNQGSNVSALYNLGVPISPFNPRLTYQPGDFAIGLNFSQANIKMPGALAIDGAGAIWIDESSSVVKLSSVARSFLDSPGFRAADC